MPSFSVKIIKHVGNWQFTGIAFNSPYLNGELYQNGWCIHSASGGEWALGANYHELVYPILEGEIITVVVDLISKTIAYKVNENSSGLIRPLNLTDSEIMLLPVASPRGGKRGHCPPKIFF